MFLESGSFVTSEEGIRHTTMLVQGQSFLLIKSQFSEIGSKKHDFGIDFRGFECMGGLLGLPFEWV